MKRKLIGTGTQSRAPFMTPTAPTGRGEFPEEGTIRGAVIGPEKVIFLLPET